MRTQLQDLHYEPPKQRPGFIAKKVLWHSLDPPRPSAHPSLTQLCTTATTFSALRFATSPSDFVAKRPAYIGPASERSESRAVPLSSWSPPTGEPTLGLGHWRCPGAMVIHFTGSPPVLQGWVLSLDDTPPSHPHNQKNLQR